jgi:DNA-binding CsgD family transcriptional regulator
VERIVRRPRLTAREVEVLQAIADGHHNREIAELLVIGQPTVKTHVARLFARLSARTRAHAVAIGFRNDLIR